MHIQPSQKKYTTSQISLPAKYFDLVQKIGAKGNYQQNLFKIFSMLWFVSAFFALGTSFLFFQRSFDCKRQGLLAQDCYDSVCMLNQDQWIKFLSQKQIESLATQFDNYYCQNQSLLNYIKTSVYVGTFFGYLVFAYISDNFGRKFSIMASWIVSCLGITILVASPNIWVAAFGLFLTGGGTKGTVRITGAIYAQVVESTMRQKYIVWNTCFEGFAGISVGILYLLIPEWRIVTGVFVGVPSAIALGFLYFYLQETPKQLLKKNRNQALRALNRIAKINKAAKQVSSEDINAVIYHQNSIKIEGPKLSSIDLFKYKSLRVISVSILITFSSLYFLYIGPTLIISSFGFSPYISQIIVVLSQLIADFSMGFFIERIPRVKSGVILFAISSFFTGMLIFIQKPLECQNCIQGIIQLIFIFISRLCITLYFAVFIVFILQLYPQSIRSLGGSTGAAIGTLTTIAGPVVIGYFTINKLNTMLLFTFAGLAGVGSMFFLPETLNKPLKEEIDQIIKDQYRQEHIIQSRSNKLQATQTIKRE